MLILPLLGGYFFVSFFIPTRFFVKRHYRERLIFGAALAALFFAAIARILCVYWLAPQYPSLLQIKQDLIPIDYSGTALLACTLGLTMWLPANLFLICLWQVLSKSRRLRLMKGLKTEVTVDNLLALPGRIYKGYRITEDRAQRGIINFAGNDPLHAHLYLIQSKYHMVSITLVSSGKVFAGYIEWLPHDLTDNEARIKLLVIASGYRDSCQRLHLTNWYLDALDHLGALPNSERTQPATIEKSDSWLTEVSGDDFHRIISVSQIEYVALFNPHVYAHYRPSPGADSFPH